MDEQRYHPAHDDFATRYKAGQAQVMWTSLLADLETPVSAFLKVAGQRANAYLLESVTGGDVRGRYSIIGLDPDLIWQASKGEASIHRLDAEGQKISSEADGAALPSLKALVTASTIDLPEDLPPMAAGIFGYLGYDMVRTVEDIPDENADPLGLPDGLLLRPRLVAVFDGIKDEITLITPVRPEDGIDADAAYNAGLERLEGAVDRLLGITPLTPEPADLPRELGSPRSNMAHADYLGMVERAKEYILAGDIFQVVPSQRFELDFPLSAFSLYRSLRRLNPSPFLYYLNFEGFSVVGSSPEILVRLRDNRVTVRPIAGTRPRGATPPEDRALEADLLSDQKELAEHLMLLDLGRNDVGRVAKIGTVQVTEQFVIERYSHVMHIVSNVEGEVEPEQDAISALMAGFPAGTVSGAPKVRAMEIIEELEQERRGPYAGAIGYFSANGSMDTCIVLRTALVKDGKMYVQAGGGVVADSDPESEFQETRNKARALIHAADDALKQALLDRRNQR